MARAVPQLVDRRAQVDHGATLPAAARGSPRQHRAAAGGEHDVLERGQFLDHRGLARAEARLAFDLEDDGIFTPVRLSITWSES